jgi:alpha-N-arabinofuranosidase
VDMQETPAMAAVAGCSNADDSITLKVVNTAGDPQDTEIVLKGVASVASEGTAEVLTSSSPDDENSVAEPAKVVPVTRKVTGIAAKFRYTFDPHSVTILKIKATTAEQGK